MKQMPTAGRCSRALTLSLFALGCCAAPACDDGGGAASVDGLYVSLYTAPGAADPFDDVGLVRVRAIGDGLAAEYSQVATLSGSGQVVLEGIPFSSASGERQIIVEGWSLAPTGAVGALVSRGQSVRVTVGEGQPPQALAVLFARVNTFLPLTGATSLDTQVLLEGRVGQTVTKTDKGEVVIMGGATLAGTGKAWWSPAGLSDVLRGVEVVSEMTNRVSPHPTGLVHKRVWHTATALYSGQVIVAGGFGGVGTGAQALDLTEVYSPGGGEIKELVARLAKPRAGHTATLLDPGTFTMLFVGGDQDGEPTFEVWDPNNGTTGARPLPDGALRSFQQATLFDVPSRAEPAVLITGGESASGPLDSALVYDVAFDEMFVNAGRMNKGARTQHTATYVAAQRFIYVVGGYATLDRAAASSAIDVYDVASDTFLPEAVTAGLFLRTARGGHAAVLLDHSAVLLVGGTTNGGTPLDSIEIIHQYYEAPTEPGGQARMVIDVADSRLPAGEDPGIPFMSTARFGASAIRMDSGMALVAGGAAGGTSAAYTLPLALDLYNPQ